jgi:hypothetical protein
MMPDDSDLEPSAVVVSFDLIEGWASGRVPLPSDESGQKKLRAVLDSWARGYRQQYNEYRRAHWDKPFRINLVPEENQ